MKKNILTPTLSFLTRFIYNETTLSETLIFWIAIILTGFGLVYIINPGVLKLR